MFTRNKAVLEHYDESRIVQYRFVAHAKARVNTFQEAGNPFDENSDEVVIIDTRDIMTDNVAYACIRRRTE